MATECKVTECIYASDCFFLERILESNIPTRKMPENKYKCTYFRKSKNKIEEVNKDYKKGNVENEK